MKDDVRYAEGESGTGAVKIGMRNTRTCTDTLDGNAVPALLFGDTKMNNNFTFVDEVVKEVGGTASVFVKSEHLSCLSDGRNSP